MPEDGVRPDPEKVKAILQIPALRNVKQLRRFLGICLYQSRFVVRYSQETELLHRLLQKGVKWKWTEEINSAFTKVKHLFADSVLLQKPDYEHMFVIYTDASAAGIACFLAQEVGQDDRRVISTASGSLSSPKSKMFATELEVCPIYFALMKLRNFIFGQKVVVRSDNISVSFLQRCKPTRSRIYMYIHKITARNISI